MVFVNWVVRQGAELNDAVFVMFYHFLFLNSGIYAGYCKKLITRKSLATGIESTFLTKEKDIQI
jgi:hypothetical protein